MLQDSNNPFKNSGGRFHMTKIGFIGLGVMGYPMAGHLAKAGYPVTVFNRTTSKAVKWMEEYPGSYTTDIQEMAKEVDVLCLCVGNDQDVREIIEGQVWSALKPGSVVIDHTTASAKLAREMAALLAQREISFLDAPVSGGQVGAETGNLTTMVGGDYATYEKYESLLQTYSKKVTYLGESGHGQLCKMVNQICLVGVIQGLAEGIQFAKNAGLHPDQVIEVIAEGAAGSWQMNHRAQTMIAGEFNFGFAVSLMRKDLGIVLDEARQNQSELPITALIDQFYARLEKKGLDRVDTSALITLLDHKA
jgi:3-hydroxyisobutyrate dehydrogenase-like beta-hydroxyacid dehydrogenase